MIFSQRRTRVRRSYGIWRSRLKLRIRVKCLISIFLGRDRYFT